MGELTLVWCGLEQLTAVGVVNCCLLWSWAVLCGCVRSWVVSCGWVLTDYGVRLDDGWTAVDIGWGGRTFGADLWCGKMIKNYVVDTD